MAFCTIPFVMTWLAVLSAISLENLVPNSQPIRYKTKPLSTWLLGFSHTLGSFLIFSWSS